MSEGSEKTITQDPIDNKREFRRILPDNRPMFYSNISAIGSSIFDFTIDFGVIVDVSDKEATFQDVARVVMSPQQALAFSEVLSKRVKQYEEQFGKIPRSPEPLDESVEIVKSG